MIRRRTTGVPVNQALYPEPARPDQPKPRPPSAPVQTHVYGQPSFARLPNIYPSSGGVSQGRSFRGEKTLGQTAQLHGRWALRGLKDALRVQRTRDAISSDARLRSNIIRALVFNLPLLLTLLFLSYVILPLFRSGASPSAAASHLWHQVGSIAGSGAVVLLNGSFQGGISERLHGGHGSAASSLPIRAIILGDFIVVTGFFRLIPVIGWPLAFIYTLWINSYYTFEYIWGAQGWTLPERIRFLQSRWAYFAGFGFPISLLTTIPFLPPLLNTTLFALLFPFCLVLASFASPSPPASVSTSFSALPTSTEDGAELADFSGGDSDANSGGGEAEWWPYWPRRVPALEGALKAAGVWTGVWAGVSDGFGHRRNMSGI